MSRTAYSALTNTWDDGDNPGAGSKTVDSTGLNGNFIKHDDCIQAEHGTDGTHDADIIDGPNLKTTAADGLTIELAGTPLKLGIKAEGVGTAFIADEAVTADKLAAECIDAADKIVDGVITGGKLADNTIPGTKLAASTVTSTKISHDNTRTKILMAFTFTDDETYGVYSGIQTSAALGVPMRLPGSVTGIALINSAGSLVDSEAIAYGTVEWAAEGKVTVFNGSDTKEIHINGTLAHSWAVGISPVGGMIIIDIELDD